MEGALVEGEALDPPIRKDSIQPRFRRLTALLHDDRVTLFLHQLNFIVAFEGNKVWANRSGVLDSLTEP